MLDGTKTATGSVLWSYDADPKPIRRAALSGGGGPVRVPVADPEARAGSCPELALPLIDGSVHRVYFSFPGATAPGKALKGTGASGDVHPRPGGPA